MMSKNLKNFYKRAQKDGDFNRKWRTKEGKAPPSATSTDLEKLLYAMTYYGWLMRVEVERGERY
ncbi:hypothetical protein [Zhongshania sp.]|uniref:hypothetical protein n=1 Tax=Zhongshania sp. TaxID=1971902 RepID=UPI0035685BA0